MRKRLPANNEIHPRFNIDALHQFVVKCHFIALDYISLTVLSTNMRDFFFINNLFAFLALLISRNKIVQELS